MAHTEKSGCNELRAVLLGWHKSGKTSVINTILGPSVTVEVSGQCIKKEKFVNNKKITLVDTPGWWKECSIKDSPELSKQALVRSVALCPPGPHAFLLAIDAKLSFTEKSMKLLVERLEILNERVWSHTIVVFTRSDFLTNKTIESRIQSEGEALQKLIKKCGHRYHIFDNTDKDNNTQVVELLLKIEDVVRQNSGRNFEIDLEELQELQRKWSEVQRKATARLSMVQEERSMIKEKEYVHRLEEIRVVLLGWVMSGKSSAGNVILNREEFKTECRTTKCQRGSGEVAGRQMTVLDTPGYWKYFSPEFNPEWVKDAVYNSVTQCKKFPHAMLLVLPADTSFTEEQKNIIEENMSVFGEQIWRHTIVLFTCGDFLGDALIEHHIESEGEALQWLIDKCGNRYHVFDNTKRGDQAQVTELLEKIEEMVAGNSLFRPGVTELHEKKAELQLSDCEKNWVENNFKLLEKEWNRRVVEFKKNVDKWFADVTSVPKKSNHSLELPPIFSEQDKNTDPPEMPVNDMESPPTKKWKSSKVSDALTEQLISLLEREWSRQEAHLMEKVSTSVLKASEMSSEVDEDEIHSSVAKVLWWLPRCEREKDTCRSSDVDD